jgi:hypothetical protein
MRGEFAAVETLAAFGLAELGVDKPGEWFHLASRTWIVDRHGLARSHNDRSVRLRMRGAALPTVLTQTAQLRGMPPGVGSGIFRQAARVKIPAGGWWRHACATHVGGSRYRRDPPREIRKLESLEAIAT